MGVTSSNKTLSTARIDCGGTFDVRLSLTAEPDITSNPADIVLILDRSGSMTGDPLASLKSGANKFIDIIDASTDGTQDGQIGGGSRIAVVSFSGTAVKDTQLITSVDDLKGAVNALSAGGYTNHADAFTKASELLSGPSTNQKVMVMFTDGKTTAGVDPNPIATAAKAMGAVIYVIGLVGSDGIDEQALRDWASDPDSAYVVITPDDEELEDIFEDLAKNISKPGATNIVINDVIDPCFRILSLSTPTKGTASLLNSTSLEWRIDELGTTASEGAVLEFTVQHIGSCSGLTEVNESISYRDDELNSVTFPLPLRWRGLRGRRPAGSLSGTGRPSDHRLRLGRIVQLDVTLKNICPHRRVALAAILTEVDELGVEHQRGMKIMTIPAHTADRCRDITVRCIKFVLPEDLVEEDPTMLCRTRNVKARFISHYIDSGFDCCGEVF